MLLALSGMGWLKTYDSRETIEYRISTPPEFTRTKVPPGSFEEFLRKLPLKPGHPQVLLHSGRPKANQDAHLAVVNIDVGPRDLQQCADAIMRLWAEYLFQKGQFERIRFDYVSGFNARYLRWRDGFRPKVKGSTVFEVREQKPDNSWKSFRAYLDSVFLYANSYSLSKQMSAVDSLDDLEIGDVFIQGGFPGHAVLVVDLAEDKSGNKMFLLLQSYMPAQEMHILKNPNGLGPWYSLHFGQTLKTPEWTFKRTDLKRFK